MKNKITKYWFLVLLLLITVSFLSIKFSIRTNHKNTIAPNTNPTPGSKNTDINPKPLTVYGKKIAGDNLKFLLSQEDFQNFPVNIDVYQETGLPTPPATLVKAVANDLNLVAKSSDNLSWQRGNNNLNFNKNDSTLNFLGSFPISTKSLSADEAKSLIFQKLVSWKLANQLDSTDVSFYLVYGQDLEPVSTESLAQVYRITVIPTLNDYPLTDVSMIGPLIEARVTKTGKLTFLKIRIIPDNYKKSAHPLRGFSEVQRSLNNGEGELYEIENGLSQRSTPPTISEIKYLDISKVDLAYTFINGISTIQPIYLFEGKATLSDDRDYTARFFLKATTEF